MNPPQVYLCSPSWTLLPPPSPYPPFGSSQCTSPKHPVSCIQPGLATRFIYDMQLYLFQEKTGWWVFRSVPSTLNPGCVGAGSQLQSVSFLLLSCWTQEHKPLNQVIKECALWQQPQHLVSHTCAQTFHRDTSDLGWDRGRAWWWHLLASQVFGEDYS